MTENPKEVVREDFGNIDPIKQIIMRSVSKFATKEITGWPGLCADLELGIREYLIFYGQAKRKEAFIDAIKIAESQAPEKFAHFGTPCQCCSDAINIVAAAIRAKAEWEG